MVNSLKKNEDFSPTPQQKKAMKSRAMGVAIVLAAFVALIYLGALAKLQF